MVEVSKDAWLAEIQQDYPWIKFVVGRKMAFRPPHTIVYTFDDKKKAGQMGAEASGWTENAWRLRLLHELGHATLGHRDWQMDVERVKMERAAWEQARGFCEKYHIIYDEELVEAELDTYREWLHQRSRCPRCGLTRVEIKGGYRCPLCDLM